MFFSNLFREIRKLSADCLAKLVGKDVNFAVNHMLPKILTECKHIDVNNRHGGLLSLGSVILAIAESEELEEK